MLATLAVTGVLIAVAVLVARHTPPIAGTARVIDGDSLMVGTKEVRLYGIDAPEARQTCQRAGRSWACGQEATRYLTGLIDGRPLTCREVDRDRFDRAVSRCAAAGQDLGAAMVRGGMAVAFGDYHADERDARDARRGLWGSDFERPADWRARHPRPADAAGTPTGD
jgi:endonuclease YncB( thermonuclease family)